MPSQNTTMPRLAHEMIVERWFGLIRQLYPDWDDVQAGDGAFRAVQDFCDFLTGIPSTWDPQTLFGTLPELLSLSDITRLFITLRESVREEITCEDAPSIVYVMERLDAWIEIVISRYEGARTDRSRKQFKQMVERIVQLNTLSHCVATLNASLDLVSAFTAGAQLAQVLTGADLCAVYQLEEDTLRLQSYAGRLPRPCEVFEITDPRLLTSIVVDAARQDLSIEVVQQNLAVREVQAVCCIPLQAANLVVGKLVIAFADAKHFTLQELRQQEIFASHLGQVIYNAQFYEHLSELTTSNERRRIACEMHDTMLQTLVSLNINLRVLLSYAHQGAWGDLVPLLEETRHLGKIAIQEGRDTLANLRDDQFCACALEDLFDLLRPQLAAFAEQSGITPQLQLIGERPYIPMNVGHQLRRLVGEALSNIHRHASAGIVQVVVETSAAEVCIQVCDDGIGFHPERVNHQVSFGLSGMRERSRLISARLTIDSAPGSGTTVRICCPLTHESRNL
ncbi:MAG: hypothetical protein K8J31_12160 [Anaerolineae bacterium]|nr:hypothetical protein [Anaerolineae bacterium]